VFGRRLGGDRRRVARYRAVVSVDRVECSWCRTQNTTDRTKCTNCGGSLDVGNIVAGSDSALSALAASGAHVSEAFDHFVEVALSQWPSLVEVEREGRLGHRRARKLTIGLPNRAFIARRDGPGIVCEVGTRIRGATVRVDQMPVREWSEVLQAEIDTVLGQSSDL
jgi:hypothetical protein